MISAHLFPRDLLSAALWTNAWLVKTRDDVYMWYVCTCIQRIDDDYWKGRASAQRFGPEGTRWASERAAIPAVLVLGRRRMQRKVRTRGLGVATAVTGLNSSSVSGGWCAARKSCALLGLPACTVLESVRVCADK